MTFSLRSCYSSVVQNFHWKISISPNQISIQGLVNKVKILWCFYAAPEREKLQYDKDLLQIFVSKKSYFNATCSQLCFFSKAVLYLTSGQVELKLFCYLVEKGDVFFPICSQGLYSVFLDLDFPVTLSTVLKYVTVLSYNYSINLMIYWYIISLAFLAQTSIRENLNYHLSWTPEEKTIKNNFIIP